MSSLLRATGMCVLLGLGILTGSLALALNEPTHELINVQATRRSSSDRVLKEELGIPEGTGKILVKGNESNTVEDWIRVGGRREDSPLCRTARHFHDPLYQADGSGRGPWSSAGLVTLNPLVAAACGGTSFPSSVHWAQEPNQTLGERGAWQDARRFFRNALTASELGDREQAFADTFRALGQQMHLVVDASVPEHVRNDPHVMESILRGVGLRGYGSYEHWVSDQHGRPGSQQEAAFITRYLSNPFDFDPAILQQPTNDTQARVPVARLIDTDLYQAIDPNVTLGSAIGIAEFANANFFSEDTGSSRLLLPNYPFPDRSRLVPSQHPAPQPGRVRTYYAKGAGDGLPVDPVLAECVLDEPARDEGILEPRTYTCVDENVWAQVAQVMLPRAIGYARGALDYFFRGTLDFTIGGSSPNQTLTITNKSNEAMDGTFTLYADNFSQERSTVKSFDLSLAAQATSAALTFTPPAEVQAYILVFHGRLGLEEGAVAGKVSEVGIGDVQIVGAVLIGPGLGTGKGFVISSASNGAVAVDMTKMFGVPATLPVGARTIAKFVMGNPSKVLFVVEDRDNKKIELFVLQIRRARSDSKLPVTDGTVILGGTQLPELDVELSFHMSHQEKSLELRRLHATANITHRTLDAFVEPDVVTVQTASISRTYRYSFMSKHVVDYYAVEASGVVDILAIVHAPDPVSLPNDQEMETVNWDPVTIPLPYDLGPVTIPPVTPFPVEQKGYLSFPTALVTPHAMPIYISAVAPSVYLVNLVTGSVILRSMEAETSISWNKHYWSSVIPIPLKQNAICPDDCAPGIRFTAEVAGFFFTLPNNYIVDPWKAEFANVQYAVEEGTNPISDVGKSFPILSDLTRGTFNVNNRVFSIVEFTLPQAMLGKPDADAFFVRIVPPTVAASQFFGPDRYVVRWDKAGPDVISGIGLAFPLQVNRQLGTVLGGPTGVLVIDRETESVHPVNQESLSEFDIRSGVIMGERRLYFTGGPVEKMTLLNLTLKDGQIVLSKTSDIAEPREGFPLFVGTAFTGAVFPLSLENKGTALSP